ncbi:GTPase HflX, partial [Bifidobacteriaceae bacterium NR003]
DIPQIIAFNKSDMMSDATREHLNAIYSNAIIVSATSGENVKILRDSIEELLPSPRVHIDAIIPYSEGSLLSKIRENGIVEKVDYLDTGISITALVGPSLAAKLKQVALQ